MRVHIIIFKLTFLLILIQTAGCSSDKAQGESKMRNLTDNISDYKFTNHLINESSPYLLQHAHNPVNWYPWGEEALTRAMSEDKPIFLSIGYAACHWCHVMEHESFENEEVARILNENFIAIKVDREQRPDLDQIYMAATMALTGSGGWPMSVFLTSDLKPFYAGTYFPLHDGYGRPGFLSLIQKIAEAYKNDRENIEQYSKDFVDRLQAAYDSSGASIPLNKNIPVTAAEGLMRNYDTINGGFGNAPKFPHPIDLSFLMKAYADNKNKAVLEALEHTLRKMADGGIYDQIGGGFHRYATDARWLVPHFEKMLYDNAMLAVTYSEAFQLTGNESYRRVVRETLDFMLREMHHQNGGFYSALDADSEGEEGKFYVWNKDEVDLLLGERSEMFCKYYNITKQGNFENNSNIPNIDSSSKKYREESGFSDEQFEQMLEDGKKILFNKRSGRVRPFTDDKILTSWNGLAISGFARGYQITGDEKYREAALSAAAFIRDTLYRNGKLIHSYRDGKASEGIFLEDYAYLTAGLIDLYEIVHGYEWIEFASKLARDAVVDFADDEGNFYLAPTNQADHYMRPKDIADGALPAPGSIMMQVLLKLSQITGDKFFQEQAEKALAAVSGNISGAPYGMISAVTALDYLISDKIELVLVGKAYRQDFLDEIYNRYFPNRIIVVSDRGEEKIDLLEGRRSIGETVAYVCINSACLLPAASPAELRKQLEKL
ncbi:MAG: thioredoxin domain-containing protein [candidate division Zixibacteria bacterium HGW-Zixibacteria-1]|nr:MAG: thioredoxin domain-containing protein [candidate division Zixibacteria bacterium HGW-Zixibacteria-1]